MERRDRGDLIEPVSNLRFDYGAGMINNEKLLPIYSPRLINGSKLITPIAFLGRLHDMCYNMYRGGMYHYLHPIVFFNLAGRYLGDGDV